MKTKQRQYNLFMLEIIIVILFFSVSSAVIVQLFVHAHVESSNSRNSLKAITAAQSVADGYRATNDLAATAALLGYKTDDIANIVYVSGFDNTDVVNAADVDEDEDGEDEAGAEAARRTEASREYVSANFDNNWKLITDDNAGGIKFSLLAREITEDNLTYAAIDVADEKGSIFSIRAARSVAANSANSARSSNFTSPASPNPVNSED